MFTKSFGGFLLIINKLIYRRRLEVIFPSIIFTAKLFSLSKVGRISLGRKAVIMSHCKIISKGELTIGSNFFMNSYSRIVSHEQIMIGNNVTIAQFVAILDHDHNYTINDNELSLEGYNVEPVKIGNNVWIADKVTICKGVTIGDNVIIAANSVINTNVPNNTIYGGVPGKLLKRIY